MLLSQEHFCTFLLCSGVGAPGSCEPFSSSRPDHVISPADWDWQGFRLRCVCLCSQVEFSPLPATPLRGTKLIVNWQVSFLCVGMLLTPVLEN